MKRLILASLAALALVPATAIAQPDGRADRHEDRRELREARDDVRDARQDLREAKRDYRDELRDYSRRHAWQRAPFRYQRFKAGATIRPVYYSRAYVITDYRRFNWQAPRASERWVRHYDDALLVNTRTGRVVKVIPNAFRHR
jgi:Ni/Co efflux regulator RcnB